MRDTAEELGPHGATDPHDRWVESPWPEEGERARLEVLKAGLLTAGLRVSAEARRHLLALSGGALTSHEYATTGGLTLDLGSSVLVNAPVDEWFCDAARDELRVDAGELEIHGPHGEVHPVVAHVPLPGYLDAIDDEGRAVTDTAFSHADRVRLSPISGCAYKCDYCDLPAERYRRRDAGQVIAALMVGLDDTALPARHAMISGGSPGAAHIDWFQQVILDVAAACPVPLDVMMSAIPGRTDVIDHLVDGGVSGFSINLELYSHVASELYIRGKHKHARPGYDDFVARAVARLGRDGGVRSLIIGGLEDRDATMAGVRHIARLGADPVLSPFRPAERTVLHDRRPPSAASMLDLLAEARVVAAEEGVHLGPRCVPCQHNTLTFPWDVRAA
jgi:hypothetical protein